MSEPVSRGPHVEQHLPGRYVPGVGLSTSRFLLALLALSVILGPSQLSYTKDLTTLGLERDCLWLGNLEPVEPFLHAIDVFVSTSEYETFGMSICEAMACSRPVAVYRAGAPGEVVGDAGLVVETGDLTGLVEAARTLIDNADLRSTLGQRGRARVEAVFNPRSSLQTLARLYRSLDRARTGSSS